MSKIIRPKYSIEFSVGLILLIGTIAGFLSPEIFDVTLHAMDKDKSIYLGMFWASLAVIIVILIIWEEILFPVRLKEIEGGIHFRNHTTKLKTQALIYCSIPLIFCFIYLEYKVNHIRFFIWAAVCIIAPVLEKIISGINNYNDFLELTPQKIEYKNNEKEGSYAITDIKHIIIVKDQRKVLQKIELLFNNNEILTIDLDEMELEAFYLYIHHYIMSYYGHLLK